MISAKINVTSGEYPQGHFQNKKLFFARNMTRIMGLCNKFIGERRAVVLITSDDGTKKEIKFNEEIAKGNT